MKNRQPGGSRRNKLLWALECLLLICFVAFLTLFLRRAVLDASARREADEMRRNILSSMPEEALDVTSLHTQASAEPRHYLNAEKTSDMLLSLTGNALRGFGIFGSDAIPSSYPTGTEITEPASTDMVLPGTERVILPEMEKAREQGDEVVGILQAGKDIDLYVVQGIDNDYYLTHNVQGRYSESGAAFLDARCTIEPRDTHIMIHGHNMRSGVIFGNLDSFRDAEYIRDYPIVHWTTLYEREVYVPYAIADINVDPEAADYVEMPKWNFTSDELFMQFVKALQDRTQILLPIDVQPGDELLSLVTCSYGYDDGRFVVALRKLRDDEDEAELTERIRNFL